MTLLVRAFPILGSFVLIGLLADRPLVADSASPSFNRDIRPLLSDRCFHCHGPDESSRKGGLRLDVREEAVESAILPGNASESELVARLLTADEDDRMPPPDSGAKPLSDNEIQVLRRWIDAGAEYERHWAFVPVRRPVLPDVRDEAWVRNPIDTFVLARLEAADLKPSPEALPRTLLRRVSLDLTGLPPGNREVGEDARHLTEGNYEQHVDRLLASKRYGERMAMAWLDAARYADTDGFQADATRHNWAWRDWVIGAYNRNLPFDQFTLEQFAGDLLPNAQAEQILATCFHRNHMTNGEGGRDPEESRIDYVIDRVNTMGTVWLGLTLGCAQCHSHKFDPISQAEYYQLNAFFNSIDEDGRAGSAAKPFVEFRSPHVDAAATEAERWLAQKEAEFGQVDTAVQDEFANWLSQRLEEVRSGHASWSPLPIESLATTSDTRIQLNRSGKMMEVMVTGSNPRHDDYVLHCRPELSRVAGVQLSVLPMETGQGYSESEDGHVILTNVKFGVQTEGASQLREIEVISAVADYENQKKGARDYGLFRDVLDDDPRTGWTTNGSNQAEARVGVFQFAEPVVLSPSERLVVELRHRSLKGFSSIRRFRLAITDERGPVVSSVGPSPREQLAALVSDGKELSAEVRESLWAEFVEDHAVYQKGRRRLSAARKRVEGYNLARKPQKVMVLRERDEARETHVLVRGVWDQKGSSVTRGLPSSLSSVNPSRGLSRLDLAAWLVNPENPLTARVTVNRYWQMYFGYGLVRTPEDFGRQGEAPTHPELLDWLAAEFIESGWDIKHMQRLIVSSATYRQQSTVQSEAIQRDPENRLLARATRFRLPSWMIRDVALASSGLLVNRLGGPPVYPYQPPGLWADSTMGRFHYEASVGSDLYRRSIYGFWRRSVGPALMFDASKRRVCQVRVTRTSTPLQALTLMNDRTFIEAGCHLAWRVGSGATDPVATLCEHVLSRQAQPTERGYLDAQWREAQTFYQQYPFEARQLMSHLEDLVTLHPADDIPELAALAVMGMTLFNLDEAMTRE